MDMWIVAGVCEKGLILSRGHCERRRSCLIMCFVVTCFARTHISTQFKDGNLVISERCPGLLNPIVFSVCFSTFGPRVYVQSNRESMLTFRDRALGNDWFSEASSAGLLAPSVAVANDS